VRQGTLGLFLIAPALALLAAVLAWPMLSAIVMSFQDVRVVGSDGPFIGLANYEKVLADPAFWRAAKLSLVWVVANAVVQTALALAAALILNQRFRGVQIARTWIILSWIVPTVVVVMIWRWLFSTSGGVVNPALMGLGLSERPVGSLETLHPYHMAAFGPHDDRAFGDRNAVVVQCL
jgi:multiple sugar transport system permease protein